MFTGGTIWNLSHGHLNVSTDDRQESSQICRQGEIFGLWAEPKSEGLVCGRQLHDVSFRLGLAWQQGPSTLAGAQGEYGVKLLIRVLQHGQGGHHGLHGVVHELRHQVRHGKQRRFRPGRQIPGQETHSGLQLPVVRRMRLKHRDRRKVLPDLRAEACAPAIGNRYLGEYNPLSENHAKLFGPLSGKIPNNM